MCSTQEITRYHLAMDDFVGLASRINDKLLSKLGIYITNKKRNFRLQVAHHLRSENISVVFDVGASYGQYGVSIRRSGYRGEIYSFEPIASEYNKLKILSKIDGRWSANQFALGASTGTSTIFVSENSVASTLLEMTPDHLLLSPESKISRVEPIRIETLDNFISDNPLPRNSRIHLKIDVQGYEKFVLDGAMQMLRDERLLSIEIELQVAELYFNQYNWLEVANLIHSQGFELFSSSMGFFDQETGRLLQLDCLFTRRRNCS
jgi:FkbM family methyltransferase